MNSLRRVFILGHFEGAANNRTDLECKGLVASGVTCSKINLLSKVKSRFLYPIRLFKSFQFLFKVNKKDIVIIYGESPFFVIDTFFLRLRGCKIVFERTEYPNSVLYGTKQDTTKKSWFDFMKNLKYASGFITCSNALNDYYKEYLPSHIEIFKLTLLVDSTKFNYKGKGSYDFEYIAYCGYMGGNKDGVSILIESFKKISSKYPNIKLLLIGTATVQEVEKLKQQAKDFEDNILFTGAVSHEIMPKLLASAKLLALARPDNKQAEGGFPSKLGEYLSTGKPVVVTKVGEISLYVQDKVNGYLAEPDSIDSFANTMQYVLDHYNDALLVGENGFNLAKKFDYLNQGLILKDYIMKL